MVKYRRFIGLVLPRMRLGFGYRVAQHIEGSKSWLLDRAARVMTDYDKMGDTLHCIGSQLSIILLW